uniref:G-protein coupled receptors family 1 profile domain-containing protein n=1 Tax=Romanomermis culicivorax TaxID=13658 RepID=A0A915KG96_ROMCU
MKTRQAILNCAYIICLTVLLLSTAYIYTICNDELVYCTTTGAGMSSIVLRFLLIIQQFIRIGGLALNLLLYSRKCIHSQQSSTSNEQKQWLAAFKDSQKPFFRQLLFITISSFVLSLPFFVVEFCSAYISDPVQQKIFRSIAVASQYCAFITDAIFLIMFNKQIRPAAWRLCKFPGTTVQPTTGTNLELVN